MGQPGDGGTHWRHAAAGVAAAGVLFGVAQLLAAFFSTVSSPLTSVGAAFIDFTPGWLKDFAISTFGTADKSVLVGSLMAAAALLAAGVGLAAHRSLRRASVLVVLAAVVMGACIITRSGASIADLVPLAAGTAAGLWALQLLVREAGKAKPSPGNDHVSETEPSRRRFLLKTGAVAISAVVLGFAGSALSRARDVSTVARETLKLPAAKVKARPLPAGVQSPTAGTVLFITPNDGFYRIDTALAVPQLDPATWSLHVHGMVENEFTMTFAELLASDLVEARVTLTCVSNEVGGDLAGNALWLGLPLRTVLARARPTAGADMVLSTSADGFTASTPLPVLQDGRNALLAVGMNGQPLPAEHGFPVRMVVPGLYGYVSATKWVVELEVTTFSQQKAYWTTRGWSAEGPIKTASRIEVPRSGQRPAAGRVALGGTAWAQTRGISKVEVKLDDGPWNLALLAAEDTVDSWRQWSWMWEDATPGRHTATVRAWDGDGTLQEQAPAPPAPDGASGWHQVNFEVSAG